MALSQFAPFFPLDTRLRMFAAPVTIAILLGIVMPVVSAILFPTYMHQMPLPAWEWLRLLEMQYAFFEIAIVLWASRRAIDREAMWRRLPPDVRFAVGILIVSMLISSLFVSNNVATSITMTLIYTFHGLFAFAVYHLFITDHCSGYSKVMPLHAIGLIVLALYTTWWFAFPPPPETVMGGIIEWRSAIPGFISVRHFGAWTGAIATGYALQILLNEERLNLNHLFYLLAAGLTIWSGTRAAILAIIVVVSAVIILRRHWPSFTATYRAFAITLLALGLAWLLRWEADTAFLLFVQGDYSSVDAASSNRTLLWSKAIDLWASSPVFGWGTGSFFWEGNPFGQVQPHNFVLQFLVSWGLVGTIAGVWLVGRGIGFVHAAATRSSVFLAPLGMIYALLFQSLLEGTLHYPRFIVSIISLGALILAQADLAEKASQQSR